MSQSSARMPLIDALKAIASQLIVLHHLSAYGPLSVTMQQEELSVFLQPSVLIQERL